MRSSIRQILLMLSVIAVVLGSLTGFVGFHWSEPVNEWNSRRIKTGMTEQQVTQLLGGPGQPAHDYIGLAPRTGTLQAWYGEDYCVQVAFDGTRRVVQVRGSFTLYRWKHQEPWTIRVRRWIELNLR